MGCRSHCIFRRLSASFFISVNRVGQGCNFQSLHVLCCAWMFVFWVGTVHNLWNRRSPLSTTCFKLCSAGTTREMSSLSCSEWSCSCSQSELDKQKKLHTKFAPSQMLACAVKVVDAQGPKPLDPFAAGLFPKPSTMSLRPT